MSFTSFDHGWAVGPKISPFAKLQGHGAANATVDLPHDALLARPRSAEVPSRGRTAYFPSAAVEYSKTFDVPEQWRDKRVSVEFEAVYRDAMVYVNGTFAGQRPNGYSPFRIALDPHLRYGQSNTIRVDARTHEDSRWYAGAGIHRGVRLIVTDLVHVDHAGIVVTTKDLDEAGALIEIVTPVVNEGTDTATVRVHAHISDPRGESTAADEAPITLRAGARGIVRQRLYIASPARWSVESPALHTAVVSVGDDSTETHFGIRSLQADPVHGLRINGQPVKLRGACIHHDNGPLGAAAIPRAEERRVELLKQAGFNAIRSSHNPVSRAMLDACDRIGMLVVDETFDMWTEGKSNFDYSLSFPEWWERDVEAMVAKDINHPSVIMYSIGNEVFEAGDPLGAEWGRLLAERVRSLDPSRLVTNGINPFVAILDQLADRMSAAGSEGGVNAVMNMADMMAQISVSPIATEHTESSFAILDVAGMNYADARYEADREAFPHRVIVGSETYPPHIAHNWDLVMRNAHVIGDFTWTGWDYLGEVGIGGVKYADEEMSFEAPYPWTSARSGDIDVTGRRRPVSYYREIVFGLRSKPYIAVQRPENHDRTVIPGMWAWSDTESSWTWGIDPGSPVRVEVYSNAEEIELVLNGASLGRATVGEKLAFRADFDLSYEPGTLEAISFRNGEEVARTMLQTADEPVGLGIQADRTTLRASTDDLAYLDIALEDAHGRVVTSAEAMIRVKVDGPATLAAVASARPDEYEPFGTPTTRTFEGRALAIVRPNGSGAITVTAEADGLSPVTIELSAGAGE